MKRHQKPILSLLAALLWLLILPLHARAADSLLRNGELAGEGVPEGWTVRSYQKEEYAVSTENGETTLTSFEANDLRVCQTLEVKENTAYVFSAEVAASNVMGGRGATLSIDNYGVDGCYIYSRNILGSVDWTPIELIFRTGEGQTTIVAALRLGGYSEMSAGTVRFRNIRLEPAGEGVAARPLSGGGSSHNADTRDNELSEARQIQLRSYLHLFMVLAVVDAVVLIFGFYRNRERIGAAEIGADKRKKLFLLAAMAGLVLRSLLSAAWGGHDTDMSCWIGWGNYIAQNGPGTFYTAPGHDWYDYPPGYMLVLGLISRTLSVLRVPAGSKSMVFAYMLPAALADIGTAALLMRCARRKGFSDSWQLLLGGLALFNPAIVMLSGAWGQIDSILTLLLLLSFTELTEGRRVSAGALYGLAIMTKWQALIYGPVLACAYILHMRTRRDIGKTVAAVAAALGVIFAVSLPFRGDQGFFWIVEKFFHSAGGYHYASVEAYNFLALCGGNWASVSKSLLPGISYGTFGTAAILLAVTLSLFLQWQAVKPTLSLRRGAPDDGWMLYLSASFCMYMIFTFGQYMHERYVFPVILLLMMVFVMTKEPRWLLCSLLLSVVVFLNEATAMYVISKLASATVRGGREHNTVVTVCSFAETASFAYFAYLCATVGRRLSRKEENGHA